MEEILKFLSALKDPVMGLVIVGLFYILWMKEKYCQGMAVTLTKAVTILEMLYYGHDHKGDK